jgi:F-type H+-transporting ATPase subunit epsilon
MAFPFEVEVVAVDHKVFLGQAVSLVAPAVDGYVGVLRGHAPLVAALATGILTITPAEKRPVIEVAVSGGFMDVTPDRVTILADTAELAEEIDLERARQARVRAEQRLLAGASDIDITRAQAALLRAINRIRAAEQPRM